MSQLTVGRLMETRFMFPASRSQQVMNTEYAFCNAAIGEKKKKKVKRKKDWIDYAKSIAVK